MDRRQAKRKVHSLIWRVLEGRADTAIQNYIINEVPDEADQLRLLEAYDEIVQEHYNRSCGNIKRPVPEGQGDD